MFKILILILISFNNWANGVVLKQKIPLTDVQQYELQRHEALNMLSHGDIQSAIIGLQTVIEGQPKYLQARLDLATIYREQGWDYEAELLLKAGLKHTPYNYLLLQHLASVLQERNFHQDAIKYLLKVPKSFRNNVKYKAMLATSYFESGIYNLSSKHYKELVANDSLNSTWWLGLAISQQAEGENASALVSFKKVFNLGEQEANIISYVKTRIQQLENTS